VTLEVAPDVATTSDYKGQEIIASNPRESLLHPSDRTVQSLVQFNPTSDSVSVLTMLNSTDSKFHCVKCEKETTHSLYTGQYSSAVEQFQCMVCRSLPEAELSAYF
jgi:hypothetical protein